MALGRVTSVVTLDALGTLVALAPPAPLLVAELRARGVQLEEAQAAAGVAAEIAYYRAHHDLGADGPSLALLRMRCTEVLRVALQDAGAELGGLGPDELRDALLASLRFEPFDDVRPALAELRAAGHRLVVVSNWDVSLHEMLRTTGLDALVDGAISSAEAGVRKPAAAIFQRALALAGGGGAAGAALHAGDSLELDVAGALAAGMRAVLVVRAPGAAPRALPDGVTVLESLAGLAALADATLPGTGSGAQP